MKRLFGILLLVCIGASTALAQGGLGVFGSYWDSKDADDAFGGGALLRMELGPAAQLDIRGSYYKFDDRLEGIKAELQIIPLEAAFTFKLGMDPQFSPYVGGGIGYYFTDADLTIGDLKINVDFDDEIGFFALGGLQFSPTYNLALFGEVKYTWLDYDRARIRARDFPELGTERVDVDLKMNGIGVNIGLVLLF